MKYFTILLIKKSIEYYSLFINPIISKITIPILEILTLLITTWFAITATIALTTWKKQTKTKHNINLLNELLDTINNYIQQMSAPIQSFYYIKMFIDIHFENKTIKNDDEKYDIYIKYIKENGVKDKEKLIKYLSDVRPAVSKLQSLSIKIQINNLTNYKEYLNYHNLLIWTFNQIESFAYIIGQENLNWNNSDIKKSTMDIMNISFEQINTNFNEQIQNIYRYIKRIYKNELD